MLISESIEQLEKEWDTSGFLGAIRDGQFVVKDSMNFLEILKSINLSNSDNVPKRLLSMLWYLPSYLQWQRERVSETGGDLEAYDRFITKVHNILEDALGVP